MFRHYSGAFAGCSSLGVDAAGSCKRRTIVKCFRSNKHTATFGLVSICSCCGSSSSSVAAGFSLASSPVGILTGSFAVSAPAGVLSVVFGECGALTVSVLSPDCWRALKEKSAFSLETFLLFYRASSRGGESVVCATSAAVAVDDGVGAACVVGGGAAGNGVTSTEATVSTDDDCFFACRFVAFAWNET